MGNENALRGKRLMLAGSTLMAAFVFLPAWAVPGSSTIVDGTQTSVVADPPPENRSTQYWKGYRAGFRAAFRAAKECKQYKFFNAPGDQPETFDSGWNDGFDPGWQKGSQRCKKEKEHDKPSGQH
ncbi:hypothetical protein GCM10010517_75240 [Streptosporangium fragile]|uniref:Uncharacterized protein n=1 Tax=Streptosporangium fragile TaxID=46186 RepID=A0ABN3WC82_9ACTN